MASMEISAKPIVFRASYRDINMITAITNKAINLYGNSRPSVSDGMTAKSFRNTSESVTHHSYSEPVGKARVLMTKEQVCMP
jgi:vacuolar protein sorting-associated protein 13A/C